MKALSITTVAIGSGMAAFAIGSRLPTDVVAMAVGLIFGALPLLLLALVNRGRVVEVAAGGWQETPRTPYDDWADGYAAGEASAAHPFAAEILCPDCRLPITRDGFCPACGWRPPHRLTVQP